MNKWAQAEFEKGGSLFDTVSNITKTKEYQTARQEGKSHEEVVANLIEASTKEGWTPLADALGMRPTSVDENGVPTWGEDFKGFRNNLLKQVTNDKYNDWATVPDKEKPELLSQIRTAIHTNELPPITEAETRGLKTERMMVNGEEKDVIIGAFPDAPTEAGIPAPQQGTRIDHMPPLSGTQVEPVRDTSPARRQLELGDLARETTPGQTISQTSQEQIVTPGLASRLQSGQERLVAQAPDVMTKAQQESLARRTAEADIAYKIALTNQIDVQLQAIKPR